MLRYLVIVSTTLLFLASSGCVSSMQRVFDRQFDAQETQRETETMFPGIPSIYGWLAEIFLPETMAGTKALPSDVRFEYSASEPTADVSNSYVHVRLMLAYLTYSANESRYLDNFAVQDNLVVNFCREHGYTVKKYKFGFSAKLFESLGLRNASVLRNPVEIHYGYSYVIADNNGLPLMIYMPVVHGNYSTARMRVTSYEWFAFFISQRESIRFLDSLPNSFISDMSIQ